MGLIRILIVVILTLLGALIGFIAGHPIGWVAAEFIIPDNTPLRIKAVPHLAAELSLLVMAVGALALPIIVEVFFERRNGRNRANIGRESLLTRCQ